MIRIYRVPAFLATIVALTLFTNGSDAEDSKPLTDMNVITMHDYNKIYSGGSSSHSIPVELEKAMRNVVSRDSNIKNNITTDFLWEEQQRMILLDFLLSGDSSEYGTRLLMGQEPEQKIGNTTIHSLLPFLLCNSKGKMSGSKRHSLIETLLSTSGMKALFSNDSISCFVALLMPSDVENIATSSTESHAYPLTPLMKIHDWSYTMEAIRSQIGVESAGKNNGNEYRGLTVAGIEGASPSAGVEITVEFIAPRDFILADSAVDILKFASNKVIVSTLVDEESNDDSPGLRGRYLSVGAAPIENCSGLTLEVDNVFPESSSISVIT